MKLRTKQKRFNLTSLGVIKTVSEHEFVLWRKDQKIKKTLKPNRF